MAGCGGVREHVHGSHKNGVIGGGCECYIALFVRLFYHLALLMHIHTAPDIPNYSRINNADLITRYWQAIIYVFSVVIVSKLKGRVFLVGTLLTIVETHLRLDILLATITHIMLYTLFRFSSEDATTYAKPSC